MELTGRRVARRRPALIALAAAVVAPLAVLASPIGRLIDHFHVTYDVAALIVSLITAGSWELALLFPWVIPVEVTVEALIAIFGAAYAIGW
ncbi:MAG: hypothetical protein IRZ05_19130 [Micromonosporaceae bacterium]|jgi:hypothetical protein|nr:hypothetical protein [Micromonosporaceae bacterium]